MGEGGRKNQLITSFHVISPTCCASRSNCVPGSQSWVQDYRRVAGSYIVDCGRWSSAKTLVIFANPHQNFQGK